MITLYRPLSYNAFNANPCQTSGHNALTTLVTKRYTTFHNTFPCYTAPHYIPLRYITRQLSLPAQYDVLFAGNHLVYELSQLFNTFLLFGYNRFQTG